MDNRDVRLERQDDTPAVVDDVTENRKNWQEPKLTFVEPALTQHGPLTSVTGQFFGAFSPPAED